MESEADKPTRSVRDLYFDLLSGYLSDGREEHLTAAARLGRELVLANVPPEEIGEIQEDALCRLAENAPETALRAIAGLISVPLTESLMAYGLAFREHLEGQERQATIQALLEHAPPAIIAVNDHGETALVNEAAIRMFGYQREELVGKPVADLLPEPFRTPESVELQQDVSLLPDQAPRVGLESVGRRKNGEEFPAEVGLSAIQTKDGSLAISFIIDITNRKQAQESLRESQQDLAIRNRISEVFLTAPDEEMYREVLDIVLEAMESRYGLFGYVDEDGSVVCPSMTRDVWEQCQVPDKTIVFPRESWGGIWGRSLTQKRSLYANEGLKVPEGHVRIHNAACASIIHQGEVIGILQVGNKATGYGDQDMERMEDIARHIAPVLNARLQRNRQEKERKRAEQELKSHAVRLEQSNRELEQFAYVSSHDLQEPLRKIQAFGERLQAKYADALPDTARDYIERMRSAAGRMQNMIAALLEYSRITFKGQPFVPVDLAQVTREAVADLEVSIERAGGQVEVGDLPPVEGDPLQLRQLLLNLIGNGLKFRRPDTPPLVKVYGARVEAADPAAEQRVQITVEDNGIGFEEKHLDRIFEPFERLHGRDEYEGTGIGLAICRKIVERHGGSITAESAPGHGTTMIATLPARQTRERRAGETASFTATSG